MMNRGIFAIVAAFLMLLVLAGCAGNRYVPCCARDGLIGTNFSNGSFFLEQPARCVMPNGTLYGYCDYESTLGLWENGTANCSSVSAGQCERLETEEACKQTSNCQWVDTSIPDDPIGSGPKCVGGTIYNYMPICVDGAPSSCINNRCNTMMCGYRGIKPSPPPSSQDWKADGSLPFSTSEAPTVTVNLQGTSCQFKPMDRKLFNSVKNSKGSLWVNSFRFGVGKSFQDFDQARLFFPSSDSMCNGVVSGTKDRFVNYLHATANFCTETTSYYACMGKVNFTTLDACELYCNDAAQCTHVTTGMKYGCLETGFAYNSKYACSLECKIIGNPNVCAVDPNTYKYLEPDGRYRMKFVSDYYVTTNKTDSGGPNFESTSSFQVHTAGMKWKGGSNSQYYSTTGFSGWEWCDVWGDESCVSDEFPWIWWYSNSTLGALKDHSWARSDSTCTVSNAVEGEGGGIGYPGHISSDQKEPNGILRNYFEQRKQSYLELDNEYYEKALMDEYSNASLGYSALEPYPFECINDMDCISGACSVLYHQRQLCYNSTTGQFVNASQITGGCPIYMKKTAGWCEPCTYSTLAVQKIDYLQWNGANGNLDPPRPTVASNSLYCPEWRGQFNFDYSEGPYGNNLSEAAYPASDYNPEPSITPTQNNNWFAGKNYTMRNYPDYHGRLERSSNNSIWRINYSCAETSNANAPFPGDLQMNLLVGRDVSSDTVRKSYWVDGIIGSEFLSSGLSTPANCQGSSTLCFSYTGFPPGEKGAWDGNIENKWFNGKYVCASGWGSKDGWMKPIYPGPAYLGQQLTSMLQSNVMPILDVQGTATAYDGSGTYYQPIDICRRMGGDGTPVYVIGNNSMLYSGSPIGSGGTASLRDAVAGGLVGYLGNSRVSCAGAACSLNTQAAVLWRAALLKKTCRVAPLTAVEIDGYENASITQDAASVSALVGSRNSGTGMFTFFYAPNGGLAMEKRIYDGTPDTYANNVDMFLQEWYPNECGATGDDPTYEFESRLNFSRTLAGNFSKPSIIWKFHLGENCNPAPFFKYLFEHKGELVDAGILGIVYDNWMTETGRPPRPYSTLNQRPANYQGTNTPADPKYINYPYFDMEKPKYIGAPYFQYDATYLDGYNDGGSTTKANANNPFCSLQNYSKLVLGISKHTYGQKLYAENKTCVCQRCGKREYDMGLCDKALNTTSCPNGPDCPDKADNLQLYCNDATQCALPGSASDHWNYYCSPTCVNYTACQTCESIGTASKAMCRVDTSYGETFKTLKNYSDLADDAYWDITAALRPQEKCCLETEINNATLKYTFVERKSVKQRAEFLQYPRRGETGMDCGRTPDTSLLKYCNVEIPLADHQMSCWKT